jgi:nucleoside-diphosphate-sugar epimerase
MRSTTYSDLRRICVDGSNTLFEAARRAGVERIVFISTISAFDGCRSAYGKTKLAVEKSLAGTTAVVLRPGLVFGGSHSGGVFGSIRKQVLGGHVLPLIGSGTVPQFLLHAQTLGQCAASAAAGEMDQLKGTPVTLAHPRPWPFRELVRNIAISEGRDVKLVPIPWQLLYFGIRVGELLKMNLPFRSDSVISFIYSDRNPDFAPMQSLGIAPVPYAPVPQ